VIKTLGYAAPSATAPLAPFAFDRRDPGPRDVQLDILFCGICHSDLHTARSEWAGTVYPCVPGHEIVGRVVAAGADVLDFKVGDLAAVGCYVDSCRSCAHCRAGEEQYCARGATFTYNSPDPQSGGVTYGGYSNRIVVDERYAFRVPGNLDAAAAAPLLCAGITTYTPLRHWGVEKGDKVGVVGLGGLGHMGVKFAAAMGCEVVLFTTSPGKAEDARRLGASDVVVTRQPEAIARHQGTFRFILDTVSVAHDLDAYLDALDRDGTLCLVGVPPTPHPSPSVGSLIFGRRQIAGSLIGGVPRTREMLEFCGAHGITCDVEVIPIQQVNEAYERMLRSDVKYRFVIDMASIERDGRTA
jgi:uncharacterized zinc-type alcohol dehydrogenase-like protein